MMSGGVAMSEIIIDVIGENCPVPLVETRKALKKAFVGDIVVVKGTHPVSKKEIPMAIKALELELLGVTDKGNVWEIRILKSKE